MALEQIDVIDTAAADRMLGEAGDHVRLLRQLVSQLDEMSRALIVLYLEGYNHAEIAEILGIWPPTSEPASTGSRTGSGIEHDAAEHLITTDIRRWMDLDTLKTQLAEQDAKLETRAPAEHHGECSIQPP